MKKIAFFLMMFCALSQNANSQSPLLVKDINGTSASSTPDNLVVSGSNIFFVANTETNGRELLKIDDATGTVSIVKDIIVGSGSASPTLLTDVNGILFFVQGTSIWKSDGTEAGTIPVKSFSPAIPQSLTNINGVLFFRGYTADFGAELWKSDGTEAGTVLVKDMNVGTGSTVMTSLTAVNGSCYFIAVTVAEGRELWKSDGTAEGTHIVKDIFPGTGSGTGNLTVNNLCNINGTVFFAATDGLIGNELWKTDGTEAGTVLVKDIEPGTTASSPNTFFNYNGLLLFEAGNPGIGQELWKSDGTSDGTVIVKNINPNNNFSGWPESFTELNGLVYFNATNLDIGPELWRTDGTEEGTVLVKDLFSGSAGSNPIFLTKVNNKIFFFGAIAGSGSELCVTDGTADGTMLVKDVYPGVTSSITLQTPIPVAFNNKLYFLANDGVIGLEPYKSDGTTAGTTLVKDVFGITAESYPTNLTNVDGTLFFTAITTASGQELWKSDGSSNGTVMVKEIRTGTTGSDPAYLCAVGTTLYFSATDASSTELWRSDGTADGTFRLKDFNPNSTSGNPRTLTNFNGTLFFFARQNNVTGTELWKSDGTEVGTVLVKDINPSNSSDKSGRQLVPVGNLLFFTSDDGINGLELWKTDGTTDGTVMVKDIVAGIESSEPEGLININGTLFFYVSAGTVTQVWKSDGTDAGTILVKEFPGSAFRSSDPLHSFKGLCYFAVNGLAAADCGIWKSDGTPEGTVELDYILPSQYLAILKPTADALFFNAPFNTTEGYEVLWKTDGTAAGTVPIGGADNALYNNRITSFVAYEGYNNTLYFSSATPVPSYASPTGVEPWKCNASDSIAQFVGDINPLNFSSNPLSFLGIGNTLYFTAETNQKGRELYKLDLTPVASLSTNWTGAVSTAWEDPANWSDGVPVAASSVIIPAGRPRYPLISLSISVKKLQLQTGASVTTAAGVTVEITGKL